MQITFQKLFCWESVYRLTERIENIDRQSNWKCVMFWRVIRHDYGKTKRSEGERSSLLFYPFVSRTHEKARLRGDLFDLAR